MARTRTTARRPVTVKPGVTFRWIIADCKALWEVKLARGRGTWECEVVPEPEAHVIDLGGGKTLEFRGDYIGHRQVFGGEDIRRAVGMELAWQGMADRDAAILRTLAVGQLVHYCDGCPRKPWDPQGNWRRYKVVLAWTPEAGVGLELVGYAGDWRHDLNPDCGRRHTTGHVHHDLERRLAEAGKVVQWKGNASLFFEAPSFSHAEETRGCRVHPAKLPLIDLSVPDPTPAEAACLALFEGVERVREAVNADTLPGRGKEWEAFAKLPRDERTRQYIDAIEAKLEAVQKATAKALAAHRRRPAS